MTRVLALALVAAIATPAFAQEPPQAATYRDRSGSYQSAQGTFCIPARDGSGCPTTASGQQPSTGSQSVVPASDSPAFPISGVANSGKPATASNGQSKAMWVTPRGQTVTVVGDGDGNLTNVSDGGGDALTGGILGLVTTGFNRVLNPAGSWDRMRGDATGAWSHAPASTPTAASGTVATSGSTVALTFTNTTDGEFVNPSTATFWCSWGTPAVNGAGSYPVVPNGSYRPPSRVAGTWTCLSTAASQAYTFTRF